MPLVLPPAAAGEEISIGVGTLDVAVAALTGVSLISGSFCLSWIGI